MLNVMLSEAELVEAYLMWILDTTVTFYPLLYCATVMNLLAYFEYFKFHFNSLLLFVL